MIEDVDEQFEEIRQNHKNILEEEKMEREVRLFGKIFDKASILTCMFCAKAMPDAEAMAAHVKKFHDLSDRRFRCEKCGQRFKYKKNLMTHEAKHMGKAEFECSTCHMVFRSSLTLEVHIAKEHKKTLGDDDDMEKCKLCLSKLPKAQMKRHSYYCQNKEKILEQRKANGSVPSSPALSSFSAPSLSTSSPKSVSYISKSCGVCGLQCASRQSMLRHIQRKHPERANDSAVTNVSYVSMESPTHQYACEECGKRFTTRAALTTHRTRIHTKSRLFVCECGKEYPLMSELRKHKKRVHPETAADLLDRDF